MQKFKTLSVLTCTAMFAAPLFAAPAKLSPAFTQGEALIHTMTKGQANVTDTFTPAGTDLQGYVIKSTQGGPAQVVFSNKGKYLIIGNVITPQGVNLTEKYTKELIQSKVAKEAYEEITKDNLATIADGKDSAKHKLYIVIDPNCIFCHLMYEEINKLDLVKNGDLQVKWLPAGFLKPGSLGKAAAMLTAKNPLRALIKDEHKFNVKQEEGGLKPLDQSSKDPIVQEAFAKVKANTAFFSKYGFGGTPTLIFKTQDGKYDYVAGFVKGKQLEALVKTLSAKW